MANKSIDFEIIKYRWPECGTSFALECFENVDSTMNAVKRLLAKNQSGQSGKPVRIACFARCQTEGRGTKGRIWQSLPDAGLYVSYGWRFEAEEGKPLPGLDGLSLAAAVALQRVLRRYQSITLLKWPNDVVVEENGRLRKLSGLLTECSSHSDRSLEIILGVGINLFSAKESFANSISLSELCTMELSAENIALEISESIAATMQEFFLKGFSPLRGEYNTHSLLNQRLLHIEQQGISYSARVLEVAENGGLLVQTKESGELKTVYNADIRLI